MDLRLTDAETNQPVGENDVLTPQGTTLSATAGQALNNVVVASFTDTDTVSLAGDFAATIDWGDGIVTAGAVSGGGGSFTTFSTYTYESVKLAEDGVIGLALLNSAGMLALGLLAAALGLAVGRTL